jgi:hypothetical protein
MEVIVANISGKLNFWRVIIDNMIENMVANVSKQ